MVLEALAGSVRIVDDLRRIHPEEHDVLIFTNGQFHQYSHSFPRRLIFGPAPLTSDPRLPSASSVAFGGGGPHVSTDMTTQFNHARDFEIGTAARDLGLEGLIRRSCLPGRATNYTGFRTPVYPDRQVLPFAREALKNPLTLAGVLEKRSKSGAVTDSAIWLPEVARRAFREWVTFAFSRWRMETPDNFPVTAEWKSADRWASPQESSARARLSNFDRTEAERRASAEEKRRELVTELENAQAEGASWRSLLTATGEELVAAVSEALATLGFDVVDSDALPQNKGAKREDLRVSDGRWTALVEVKGYDKSAKSNDLDQVKRAAVTFARTERRDADALWYVPNAQRDVDPSQRDQPLAGWDDTLDSFGEAFHGCVIDTRDLFDLRQRVAIGTTTAEAARRELRSAVGRYRASDMPEATDIPDRSGSQT